MQEVSREELIKVIADFLEMGHVDNIIAMFSNRTLQYNSNYAAPEEACELGIADRRRQSYFSRSEEGKTVETRCSSNASATWSSVARQWFWLMALRLLNPYRYS